MIGSLTNHLRDREADLRSALVDIASRPLAELRKELEGYDVFVSEARAVEDGLLLGSAKSSEGEGIAIRLPWGAEYAHWLVQGGTGVGKTTWVTTLLLQELARNRAIGVVDCKGDLYEATVRLIAVSAAQEPTLGKELARRLVVVNPFADHLVPLNVCRPIPGCAPEVQAYEVALAISRLFESSLGFHMENILRHLLLLLMEANLSLVEAPLVLEDEVVRGILAARSANPAVKEFFLGSYRDLPQVSKDALRARLQGFLLPENVRLMLGAEELFDLRGVLERGDPLLVFLGKGPGVPEEQVAVLGSLFVQLLLQATYGRGSGVRRPYLLALDEFFHLLDAPALERRFRTALTTVRSFGLSLMLIHHNFAQLPPSLREIMLGNCDLMAIFRTSGRNAEYLGDFLPEVDPKRLRRAWREGKKVSGSKEETRRHQLEALQRLPNRECYWYDRRKPYRSIRIRVPDLVGPEELLGITSGAVDERIEKEGWRRGSRAKSRAELRGEIDMRGQRLRELLNPPIRNIRPPEDDDNPPRPPRPKRGRLNLG